MANFHIREATREDVALLLRFIRELAVYEEAADAVCATPETIDESLFGADSNAFAWICEDAGTPIGFAVCFYSYSTWLARRGLYLEDLFVSPEARGRGAGKTLLRHLARFAVARAAHASSGACSTGTPPRSISMSRWAHARKRNGPPTAWPATRSRISPTARTDTSAGCSAPRVPCRRARTRPVAVSAWP